MKPSHHLNRWKAPAVRLAVVVLVWSVVVTVFAAQFYWLGMDWPMEITWRDAFSRAVTEWLPWLVLAPPTLWLADRFRLKRGHWLSGLWPHLTACALAALAYQGLSQCLALGGWTRIQIHAEGRMISDDGPLPAPPSTVAATGSAVAIPAAPGFANTDARPPVSGFIVIGGGPVPADMPLPRTGFLMEPPGPLRNFLRTAAIRSQYSIPIYWSIVALVWVAGYYRQLGERERQTLELKARLAQANLQALKSQLQPHFLFNTLNAIASLVRRQPEAAENMIVTLSDFLRHNLDASRKYEVPLRQEIETLDLYLEIQQIRFGERLRAAREIPPEALEAIVPAMLLQPLVENAVCHGIGPQALGGTITLRAERDGDMLRLEVIDDGVGFQGRRAAAPREGIGLSNTRARLLALYGEGHRFEIRPNHDRGIAVLMEIPWREHSANPATV